MCREKQVDWVSEFLYNSNNNNNNNDFISALNYLLNEVFYHSGTNKLLCFLHLLTV